VLGLSHFVNLLFARVLSRSGLSYSELSAVGSTTFQSQWSTSQRVIDESPKLYFDIQRLNGFTARIHAELESSLRDWRAWTESADAVGFAAVMEAERVWRRGEAGR